MTFYPTSIKNKNRYSTYFACLPVLVFVFLLAACSSGPGTTKVTPTVKGGDYIFYPPLPNTPRYQYTPLSPLQRI